MRRRVKNIIQLRVEEKQVLTFVCDKLRESITYRQILSTLDKIDFFVCFLLQMKEMRRRVKNAIQLRVEEKQVLTFVCDKLRESITYRQILSTLDKIDFFVYFLLQMKEMRRRVKNVIQLRVEEKQVLTFVCEKLRESITHRQILSTLDKIDFKKTYSLRTFLKVAHFYVQDEHNYTSSISEH